MAAFCGHCGKPIAADGRFCGACGSPTAGATAPTSVPAPIGAPPAAAVATSSSALKIVLIILVLGVGTLLAAGASLFLVGRRKLSETDGGSGGGVVSRILASAQRRASSSTSGAPVTLSKEEVGEITGKPVTEIAMSGKSDATYKTATAGFETAIEVEHEDGVSGATQSLEAARVVTRRMAGGKGESIAGLGDDALYGAFNVLYVRRNDLLLTITPPNLKQVAQMEETNNMLAQPMGSDAQRRALQKLSEGTKGDPVAGSLSKPDAMSGAIDLIHHSGVETGDGYETRSRLMARQLAEKLLSKIGT